MAANNQLPINVSIGIPAVVSDGNTIAIDENGNVSMIFFQVTTRTEKEVMASAVAHLRLGLAQLKELGKLVNDTVQTHEQRIKDSKK